MTNRRRSLKRSRARVAFAIPAILLVGTLSLGLGSGSTPRATAADGQRLPAAGGGGATVEGVGDDARKFISENCTRCHNDTKKAARLDLTSLPYNPEDPGNFATWVKVHDRVTAGEMPPEDAEHQPEAA